MDTLPLSASIRDIAFVVFKRKWSILGILFGTMLLAGGYLLLIREDLYTSVAKILLKVGHEQAPPPTVLSNTPEVVSFRINDVNSEIDILTSTDLLEALVDKFELGKERPKEPPEAWVPWLKYIAKDVVMATIKEQVNRLLILVGFRRELDWREKGIEMMLRGVRAEAMDESNVIAVSLTLPYPPEKKDPSEVAENGERPKYYSAQAVLLSEHLENYLRFRGKAFANASAVEFFQKEVDDAQARLDAAELARDKFEQEHNIVQIEEQKKSLIEHIAQTKQVLDAAQREYDRAKLKVETLESKVRSGDEPDFGMLGEFDPQSFPESLLERLTTLQLERELLRMSDADDSPRIRTNRAQFEEVIALIDSNLRSVMAEKGRLLEVAREQFQRLEAELAQLHANERQWRSLVREVNSLEETLRFFKRKLEEGSATVARDQTTAGNASVIQHPIDPIMPIGIRKTYLLIASLAAAILAAIAWAAVAEFFDHRVYSSEQLEKHVGAPVFAVVPRDKAARRLFGTR